jgi:DNA-binding NarL/FixJ family response regulator
MDGKDRPLVTTVLLADDDPQVLVALADLIGDDPEFLVVATARDADEAIAACCREHPQVAVLDVSMPGGSGVRAATELRRRCPDTKVIALSSASDAFTVDAMLAAGAVRFLTKGDPRTDLLTVLSEVAGPPK